VKRCKQCADEQKDNPHGPVEIIEVVRRDADNIPVEFRRKFLAPETERTAGKRQV